MSTVPSGKKRNIDLHIFPKERTPLHSRFNKKNGNSQKGIFILFLFYSVASFLFFAIFINSFSDTVLKTFPSFSAKKAPISRCFTDPRLDTPLRKEKFSLRFSAKPSRKTMKSIVFYISTPPDMIDKII